IEIMWNSSVKEVIGQDKVQGITVLNNQTDQTSHVAVEGVFVAIGHKPNTQIFSHDPKLVLDAVGYLQVTDQTKTPIPGIFAAGDVFDHRYRQAITAAGSGCKAALDAQQYLESLE